MQREEALKKALEWVEWIEYIEKSGHDKYLGFNIPECPLCNINVCQFWLKCIPLKRSPYCIVHFYRKVAKKKLGFLNTVRELEHISQSEGIRREYWQYIKQHIEKELEKIRRSE